MSGDSDRQKLQELSERIEKAREAADPWRKKSSGFGRRSSRGMVRAIRIGSDFVASVMVPAALGAYLDERLGTGPWLMLGLVCTGFCLGLWMLIRALDGRGGNGQDVPREQDDVREE